MNFAKVFSVVLVFVSVSWYQGCNWSQSWEVHFKKFYGLVLSRAISSKGTPFLNEYCLYSVRVWSLIDRYFSTDQEVLWQNMDTFWRESCTANIQVSKYHICCRIVITWESLEPCKVDCPNSHQVFVLAGPFLRNQNQPVWWCHCGEGYSRVWHRDGWCSLLPKTQKHWELIWNKWEPIFLLEILSTICLANFHHCSTHRRSRFCLVPLSFR